MTKFVLTLIFILTTTLSYASTAPCGLNWGEDYQTISKRFSSIKKVPVISTPTITAYKIENINPINNTQYVIIGVSDKLGLVKVAIISNDYYIGSFSDLSKSFINISETLDKKYAYGEIGSIWNNQQPENWIEIMDCQLASTDSCKPSLWKQWGTPSNNISLIINPRYTNPASAYIKLIYENNLDKAQEFDTALETSTMENSL